MGSAMTLALDAMIGSPPFSRLSHQVLDALTPHGRARVVHAGQALWWEGDCGSDVLILESGRLRSTRIGLDGSETTLAVLEPVSVLGIASLLAGDPHDSTLIALRPSAVRMVPRQAVLATMRTVPAIADELLLGLVNELRRANERHVRLINCDVRQRLLLWLWERAVTDVDPTSRAGARVVIDRTQGELADELWTTRSTLNRVIHDLEQAGEIRLEGDVAVILKPPALEMTAPVFPEPSALSVAARGPGEITANATSATRHAGP
jgi:CRP-like cAMP-binding protein